MNAAQRTKAYCIEIQVLGPRKQNGTRDTIQVAAQLFVTKEKVIEAFVLALDILAKTANPR